jgi:hypothetical protein
MAYSMRLVDRCCADSKRARVYITPAMRTREQTTVDETP